MRAWYDRELWPKEEAVCGKQHASTPSDSVTDQYDVEELRRRLETLVETEVQISQ
jgi:hypothetical protein